jgi:hypothetical protein
MHVLYCGLDENSWAGSKVCCYKPTAGCLATPGALSCGVPATANNASSQGLEDAEARKVMDKLAEFVAKNGRSFEDVTRQRNTPDGPFRYVNPWLLDILHSALVGLHAWCVLDLTPTCLDRFLFEKDSLAYAYYDRKVHEFEGLSGSVQASFAGQPPRGPAVQGFPNSEQMSLPRQNRFAEQTTPSGKQLRGG